MYLLQAVKAPADLRALAGTCRLLRHLAADIVPGLKLTLFPHQARFNSDSVKAIKRFVPG